MRSLRNWGTRIGGALAACAFLVLLSSIATVDGVPWFVLVGVACLVIVSAVRPDNALLTLAVCVPIASWVGRQWNGWVSWPELLVVAFCAGYCLRAIALPRTRADVLDPPVFVTAAAVIASLAAQLLIDAWRFGGAVTRADLWALITSSYFVAATNGEPIDAAMRLLESLILVRAAATTTLRTPALVPRLVGWAGAGAALAASLNLARLWEAATRLESPATAFVGHLLTQRLNVHYGDLNAAGSYFVLMLFAALGLALATKRRAWWIALLFIASSVWITGSRMAMTVAVLAVLLPAGARAMRIRRVSVRRTILAAAALGLVLIAGAAAYSVPRRGNQQSASAATQVRVELARTSLRMTASNPWGGVGIGRYYSRSGEFSSPELLRLFPPAIHENAHNNFLQILAELGVVGFAAVLWLLWSAARLITRLLAADPHDSIRWGLVTGLLAFVLSWLGGHPLLLDEPAFTFWLLLGAAAGWGAAVATVQPARPVAWITTVLVLLVTMSIPAQVIRQRADFELEHRGVGLSHWQAAVDGVRYRLAGATSSVFVPSSAQVLVIPLRSLGSVPDLRVEIQLDGRPADVVTVSNDRWHYLRLQMVHSREAPRFRRLDLRATPASGDSPVLMIGKVEPR